MTIKLSEDTTKSHTKIGIFDMDIFLNRLNYVFKCIGLKHSKFIGYKMQMIPILGFLFYAFNNIMLHFISFGSQLSWGPLEVFQSIY